MTTATAPVLSVTLPLTNEGSTMSPKSHWTTFLHGKKKQRGVMNATESKYAAYLEGQKLLGQVEWYAYEAVSLKLAEGSRYCPDFLVMMAGGLLHCVEVKAFWAEAAKVRIKVAADKFPFRFIAVKEIPKKRGGGWEVTEF